MLNDIKNYILEKNMQIIYKKNMIDIVNYISIDHFEEEKIIINCKENKVIIKGENLRIKKLLNNEVLIMGQIKNIELR
jgi:sporulation protein YqfC